MLGKSKNKKEKIELYDKIDDLEVFHVLKNNEKNIKKEFILTNDDIEKLMNGKTLVGELYEIKFKLKIDNYTF